MRRLCIALALLLTVALGTALAEKTEEDVWLDGSLGRLYGVLTVPETEEAVPLVILSHGFGGNHTGNRAYAEAFQALGFATFSFDFCGGGFGSRSEGAMVQMSVLTEARDLNAVLDAFAADERFGEIFLWGASQGGFVSAYVAAQRPGDMAAMVLEFPAFVIQDDAKAKALPNGSFPNVSSVLGVTVGHVYNEDATSFDIYDVIGAYTGDVLILHGDRDVIVPLRYSERAAEVYAAAELVVMPGQNHGFMGQAFNEAVEREGAFFLEHARK